MSNTVGDVVSAKIWGRFWCMQYRLWQPCRFETTQCNSMVNSSNWVLQVQVVDQTTHPPKCHSFVGLDRQIGSSPPANIKVPCKCKTIRVKEVLHLFRCYTHTHTHTHTDSSNSSATGCDASVLLCLLHMLARATFTRVWIGAPEKAIKTAKSPHLPATMGVALLMLVSPTKTISVSQKGTKHIVVGAHAWCEPLEPSSKGWNWTRRWSTCRMSE